MLKLIEEETRSVVGWISVWGRGDEDTAGLPNEMNERRSKGKQHVLRDLLLTNTVAGSREGSLGLAWAWEFVELEMSYLSCR